MTKTKIDGEWQELVFVSVAGVWLGLIGCSQGPSVIGEAAPGQAAGGASLEAPGGAAGDANGPAGGPSSGATENTGGKAGAPADQNTGGTAGTPQGENTGGDQTSPVGGTAGGRAGGAAGTDDGADTCAGALSLRCADRLSHSTTVQGRPNQWFGYACTQRWESGRETIYDFRSDQDCRVRVGLADLSTDLDLILLSGCDASSCSTCLSDPETLQNADVCASTPLDLQHGESITFDAAAGRSYIVVVDGYDYAEGTYSIEVDCVCDAPSAG